METILQEAELIAHGHRQNDYGHPQETYDHLAALLNALLRDKLRVQLTSHDVALAMIALKMVREIRKPKRDNRVDMAGYAWVLDKCAESLTWPSVPTGTSEPVDESIPPFLRADHPLARTAEVIPVALPDQHPEGDIDAPYVGCYCNTCASARFKAMAHQTQGGTAQAMLDRIAATEAAVGSEDT